jgi:hypothetical protein
VTDEEERHRWDVGMIYVTSNSLTGNFGWHYGWTEKDYKSATIIGYPGDLQRGEVIQVNSGPLAIMEDDDWIVAVNHNNPKHLGGGSGGAWLGKMSSSTAGDVNQVISVASFYYTFEPNIMFGPRFTFDNFKDLLDYASNRCND